MTDSPRNPGNAGEQSKVGAVPSSGRRRLLRAGIAAAPVVMTVVSRPVLATGGGVGGQQCETPSGFASLQASNPGGVVCAGQSSTWWKNHPTSWPSHCTSSTKFKNKFPNAQVYGNSTMMEVLNMSWSTNDVGHSVIAALLNCLSGTVPTTILDAAKINAIWSQYATSGAYSPRNGISWNHTNICYYLASTWP